MNGRSRWAPDIGALERARELLESGGSLIDVIDILRRGGFPIDYWDDEDFAMMLGIDADLVLRQRLSPRGAEYKRQYKRWAERIGAARRAHRTLEQAHADRIRIPVPQAARQARPRGRRARHVARSTSSSDPGDDDPGEPPPPSDDANGGRP